MVPIWLTAPPNGLSDAERRALEAFFVAEEVKVAADLLSLSPKTIQNELLLARQTMGESKSWMAAIRYVFYVKRQGYGFVEAPLVPKIERQIRRLIDDFLETTEANESAAVPVSEPVTSPIDAPHPSEGGRFDIVNAGFDEYELVPAEQFERQLDGLIRCAAIVYERPARRRRTRFVTALALAGLAIAGAWWYFHRPEPILSIEAVGDLLARTDIGNGRACAYAADKLTDKFQQELWGRGEAAVGAIFKGRNRDKVEAGIRWAAVNQKELAIKILGNGHRAFKPAGVLSANSEDGSNWIDVLATLAKSETEDGSVYMVRALCGLIFGSVGGTQQARDFKPGEAEELQRFAIARLREIWNKDREPLDYANALRHIAMTLNQGNRERIALCQEAITAYKRIDSPMAKRGIAKCLESIAEAGDLQPLQALKAYLAAYEYEQKETLLNPALTNNLIGGIRKNAEELAKAIPTAGAAATLEQARGALWKSALEFNASSNPAEEALSLKACLKIDVRLGRPDVARDVVAILKCNQHGLSRDRTTRLAGFVARWCEEEGVPVPQAVMSQQRNDPRLFELGKNLTPQEALHLIEPPTR